MGLPIAAAGLSTSRSRFMVPAPSSGSTSPAASQASAVRMPAPPALPTTATRLPAGSGAVATTRATSKSCSSDATRITPACRKRASTETSGEARAAVWEAAARAPAVLLPPFTAMIGLRRETRRAISAKRRGLPKDSR